MSSRSLSVLVLSEDGAKDAQEVCVRLFKKICQLIDPATQTQKIHIDPPNEAAMRIVHGNLWKARKPNDHEFVTLIRTMTNKLCEGDGFVVFHIDGDRVWSKHETSENCRKFDEQVRIRIERLLVAQGRSEEEVKLALSKLIMLYPFYSIEAWLYQSQAVLRQRCCGKKEHLALLNAWAEDPKQLDEVDKPKDALKCIKDQHNLELAKCFVAPTVYDLRQSFHKTVEDIACRDRLEVALRQTWSTLHPEPQGNPW